MTNEWRLNMVENKLLKKISTKYQNLLEKYEDKVEELSIEDIKRLIGEVRLFWYRQQTCVTYILSNIEKDDNVAYLAGAMRLDIVNDGHFDFALVGNYRVINDPIVRFTSFYFRTESEINFDYLNKYLKDCIKDLLLLFKKYQDDFYILPMEPINTLDLKQYYSILSDAAENMVLALFDNNYSSVDAIMEECCSYEDVDRRLMPEMRDRLVYDSLEDSRLPLRDKCLQYLANNKKILSIIDGLSEPQIFFIITNQYCMQALGIGNLMKTYNVYPFIRNDITFQFFSLLFYSNIMSDLSSEEYLKVYIPYVLQKAIDFSVFEYHNMNEKIGGGKMLNYLIKDFKKENIEFPMPNEIVKKAKEYINQSV